MQSSNSENEGIDKGIDNLTKEYSKKGDKWDIFSLIVILGIISFTGVSFNLLPDKSFINLCSMICIIFILAFVSLLIEIQVKKIA